MAPTCFGRLEPSSKPLFAKTLKRTISTASYLAEIGMAKEAADQLRGILAADPAHLEARYHMAQIIATTGNHSRAMEYLLAAVQSGDCPAAYWRALSNELRKVGNGDGAKQALETALRLDPRDIETWLIVGEIAWESQHAEIHQEAYAILQELAPNDPRVQTFIARGKLPGPAI